MTGWDIDIITPAEYNVGLERLEQATKAACPDDPALLGKVVALGMVSVTDVGKVGSEPLVKELGLSEQQAQQVLEACQEQGKKIIEEIQAAKEQAQQLQAASEGQPEAILQANQVNGPVRARFSAKAGEAQAEDSQKDQAAEAQSEDAKQDQPADQPADDQQEQQG